MLRAFLPTHHVKRPKTSSLLRCTILLPARYGTNPLISFPSSSFCPGMYNESRKNNSIFEKYLYLRFLRAGKPRSCTGHDQELPIITEISGAYPKWRISAWRFSFGGHAEINCAGLRRYQGLCVRHLPGAVRPWVLMIFATAAISPAFCGRNWAKQLDIL